MGGAMPGYVAQATGLTRAKVQGVVGQAWKIFHALDYLGIHCKIQPIGIPCY